jgi:hypothetical protein
VTAILQEVYANEKAASLLLAAGLQVDDEFLTVRQQAKKVTMEATLASLATLATLASRSACALFSLLSLSSLACGKSDLWRP